MPTVKLEYTNSVLNCARILIRVLYVHLCIPKKNTYGTMAAEPHSPLCSCASLSLPFTNGMEVKTPGIKCHVNDAR